MAEIHYCWRCKSDVSMLDENEWAQVAPYLQHAIEQIKEYRLANKVPLSDARQNGFGREAIDIYHKLTGHRADHPDVLWHHRLALFGPRCQACGKLLRTPHARFCAECGTARTT
jgi:hypothetical protein